MNLNEGERFLNLQSNCSDEDNEILYNLKNKYKQEVEKELNYIYSIDSRDKKFKKREDKFIHLLFSFYDYINEETNIDCLQSNYKIYRNRYSELLHYYLRDNLSTSGIKPFTNNSLKIDLTTSLKDIRTNIAKIIFEILHKELEEFKNISFYNDMEPLLLGIIDGYICICLWGYLEIESAKKDLKNRVVIEINKYSRRLKIIDELIKYDGYPSPLVVQLYNNILDEEKFNNLYNEYVDKKTRVKIKIKEIFC